MDSAKVVLVTNVGQGFGRAIALAYGSGGHDVVCADRDVDLASKTAAEIEERGGQAIPIQADMTTQMDVLNAFHKVFEIFGNLTGVVHVMIQESNTPFLRLSDTEFSELWLEDLKSTFLILKTSARLLESGFMVVTAPASSQQEPHMAALRGAVTALVSTFAARQRDVRVNLVVPSRGPSDPIHDARLVQAVLYLGSENALGIHGHTIGVELPPPPLIVETLLPEVQAALDESIRQDDLEASLFAAPETLLGPGDGPGSLPGPPGDESPPSVNDRRDGRTEAGTEDRFDPSRKGDG